MKKFIHTIFAFHLIAIVSAQNGKLLLKQPYTIPDKNLALIAKIYPDASKKVHDVDFFKIEYLSDGLKISGYMACPKNAGKFPAIIFNRGGNRDFGAISDTTLVRYFAEIASWGYVVVGSQYRGNMGSEGTEEFGGKDVNDVINLIPLLSALKNTDPERIGMYGWSRGGMMTYMALTKTSKLKAAVIGSGLADAVFTTEMRPEMEDVFADLAPEYLTKKDSILKSRSATYNIEKLCKTTPILILAGSSDWRTPPEQQFKIVQELNRAKHPVRFAFFEGGDHSLREHLKEVNAAAKDFLDNYVRDLKPVPNLEIHGD